MAGQTPEQAVEQLFGDALSCESEIPVAYRSHAPDAQSVDRAVEHAELVLKSLALIEEAPHEEGDEHAAERAHLQRLEAKLNLVLETLSGILRRERSDLPQQRFRWSRFGAELMHPGGDVPERGFLLLQPLAWLPQRLELPVNCIAKTPAEGGGSRVWLRFAPQPPSLEQALERHLFRLHRRELAKRKG
ncbi:PilZ domain-containing protein [Pseudomarimonas salicorniae]|uniref:PilZ domain-containing protein n=1 Tax=Pseudomarimonas salicorniae TaxID=2933270 RepID=A0ABT0GL42_9GAMM|nr:PilZ domain-containing protein [Lysobacter sp. CAU 1642]MCK7595153.1 PilZ domain-containing protein [Lysobacter sp. CAU 1642]